MFGKLLSTDESETPSGGPAQSAPAQTEPGTEEDSDLRQHMVSILFSRCKLTHLQTQVGGAEAGNRITGMSEGTRVRSLADSIQCAYALCGLFSGCYRISAQYFAELG